jgi:hypothetical protein
MTLAPTSRIRPAASERLSLSRGDWLIVKRHLTAGDQRRVMRGSMKRVLCLDGVERDEVDPIQAPLAQVVGYLLDWSLVDPEGAPLPIKGLTDAEMLQVLDLLPPEDCNEITNAVDKHDDRMRAERAAEKKTADGEARSSATLPSPDSSAGPTSTSPNFPSMSMTS